MFISFHTCSCGHSVPKFRAYEHRLGCRVFQDKIRAGLSLKPKKEPLPIKIQKGVVLNIQMEPESISVQVITPEPKNPSSPKNPSLPQPERTCAESNFYNSSRITLPPPMNSEKKSVVCIRERKFVSRMYRRTVAY